MKAGLRSAMKRSQPKCARPLSPVVQALFLSLSLSIYPRLSISLSLSLTLVNKYSFFGKRKSFGEEIAFSFALARSCEDRSRSAMKHAQPTCAPEKSVHGRRRRGRSTCTKYESHWVGLVTRIPSVFFDEKKNGVVMAPLHLQSQKLPHGTKWLWKVRPQVFLTQVFHKRSPLFQQECGRASIALWRPTKVARFEQAG